MNSIRMCAISTLIALLIPASATAQAPASVLPHDPVPLMALAHEKNGLVGADVKPWHIRGTYHSYDSNGKSNYDGTYEEWWVSSTRYKLSFATSKSSQTDFATGSSLLRDGFQGWLNGPELLLRASLIEPLPDVSQSKDFQLIRKTQTVGDSKIECVSLAYPIRPNVYSEGDFYPTACFDPTNPVLLVFSHGSSGRATYQHVVSFQGHYLARQIQYFVSGKLSAELNLDVIELLKESPETLIAPSSTAIPVDLTKITFPNLSKTRWPMILKKTFPVYPADAKRARIEGTVNIKATIGPDGHVENMQPIDGHAALRDAALDAVRQWRYRPFEVMAIPRPVEIEIHVIFTLG